MSLLSAAERATLDAEAAAANRRSGEAATRCALALAAVAAQYENAKFTALPAKDAYEMRQRVSEFAVALHAIGAAPEAVVIEIKRVVRASLGEGGVESRLVMQSAVTWAIKAYYRR